MHQGIVFINSCMSSMTRQNQKETGGMRMPHRRDISVRQDLLGRELRQLFEGFTQEDMPEELQRLAMQLQSAVEGRPEGPSGGGETPPAVPLAQGDGHAAKGEDVGRQKSRVTSPRTGGGSAAASAPAAADEAASGPREPSQG